MTLTIPDDVRAKAEIYVGDAAGREKTRFMLQETGLPSGLLPLRDIVECGYVEETGFVWLKQRSKVRHYFAGAGRHVTYGTEVSAVAEPGRLRKITGVKAKEMLVWVTLHEICLDDLSHLHPTAADAADADAAAGVVGKNNNNKPKKLVCKAFGGISRTFPFEAFEASADDGEGEAYVPPAGEEDEDDEEADETEAGKEDELVKKKPEEEETEKEVEEKLKELSTDAAEAVVAAKN